MSKIVNDNVFTTTVYCEMGTTRAKLGKENTPRSQEDIKMNFGVRLGGCHY